MTLSRETIRRMTGSDIEGNGGSVSGFDMSVLNGYATQSWVDENYLSVEFFSKLFKAYNGNTEVLPNNAEATVDNIKAMFGFWTEQYVSALGNYSSTTFSGTVGEVTNNLSFAETTYDVTATTAGNQLVNGTLTFHHSNGDFSGGFSIDVSAQRYSYTVNDINLL